jgi:hypothetical protein
MASKREHDHRIAVSHDDFAPRPRVIARHMSGANQLVQHRNRADSGLRDRPGDDARALGCLQHVAGFARQVGSAPLRPLRDLSIDRYTPFLAQMKNVLASAGLGSRALAYLQLVSRTCR